MIKNIHIYIFHYIIHSLASHEKLNGKRESFLAYRGPEKVINFIETRSDTNNPYTDFDTDEEDPACFRSFSKSSDGSNIRKHNLFEFQINLTWNYGWCNSFDEKFIRVSRN